jgi:hypothetical protein
MMPEGFAWLQQQHTCQQQGANRQLWFNWCNTKLTPTHAHTHTHIGSAAVPAHLGCVSTVPHERVKQVFYIEPSGSQYITQYDGSTCKCNHDRTTYCEKGERGERGRGREGERERKEEEEREWERCLQNGTPQ